MKKIFVMTLLAAVLFMPALAGAEMKWYGQFDVMGLVYDKPASTGFSGQESFTNTRFFLGTNFGLAENVEANVALMYMGSWGDDYIAGQQIDKTNDKGVLSRTVLAEANVVFKNLFDNDKISLTAGKFFYGEAGDSIFYVGLRDMWFSHAYSASSYATLVDAGMDGAKLTYDDKENFSADLVYSKLMNNNSSPSPKSNIMILNAKYKVNDNIKVRAYLYDSENTSGTTVLGNGNRNEVIGVKPEVAFGALSASGEIAQQYYSAQNNMFDQTADDALLTRLNASYKFEINDMTLTPRAQYLRAGENLSFMLADVGYGIIRFNPGVGDIESFNIGVDWTKGKYGISADVFKNTDADGGNTSGLYNYVEYDLVGKYYYTENIKFYVGYAKAIDKDNSDIWQEKSIMGVSWSFGK